MRSGLGRNVYLNEDTQDRQEHGHGQDLPTPEANHGDFNLNDAETGRADGSGAGAPLDASVSHNTTVVGGGRPSGELNTFGGATKSSKLDSNIQQNGQNENRQHQHTFGDDNVPIEKAYLNPAFYRDQPMLWIPRDELGLSPEQISKARGHGVDITDDGATLDNKAKLELQRDTLPGQGFDP